MELLFSIRLDFTTTKLEEKLNNTKHNYKYSIIKKNETQRLLDIFQKIDNLANLVEKMKMALAEKGQN